MDTYQAEKSSKFTSIPIFIKLDEDNFLQWKDEAESGSLPSYAVVPSSRRGVGTNPVKRESDLSGAGIEPTHELMTCTRIRHAIILVAHYALSVVALSMETRIIPDEDMADAATTKKVAEIFFEYLSEMYLQFGLTLLSDIFICASV
ncbi:hypothetical protein PIB30_079201 [Stylosanthes scabra]|uniref:Uncharacterized protein n=1 Tax=Stylosanthes scabra TaxID=79078 RepID=A0ABU6YNN1_9FABA|nr:hypothetical protein [Stylosanthes scabra]